MRNLLIPAILTESVADLQQKLQLAATFCTRIGVDIIDGQFVDNLTVLPEDLQNIEWHGLTHEAQLMVIEPVDYLGLLHTAHFDRVYGHIERMGDVTEFIATCRDLSLEPGLALDLYTPIEEIEKKYWLDVRGILLMATPAGFSGQKYVDITKKVRDLRKAGYNNTIQIDGGMNRLTIPSLLEAGANEFSVTSALWTSDNPALSYQELADLL